MNISQSRVDWNAYEQHRQNGGMDKDFALSIGMDPGNFAQYKRRHYPTKHPSNGNLPAIPSVHSIAPQYTSALPVHQSAPDLQDHETRLQVLESFIATLQAEQRDRAPTSAPEYTSVPTVHYSVPAVRTWKKTGAEFAEDTQDAIKRYAQQHGLQVREVWDMAARRFLAEMAEEVAADA